MSFPLRVTLANVFMCHFQKISLECYPTHLKSVVYRRYVDGTFLLFRSSKYAEKLKKYLTSNTEALPLIWDKNLLKTLRAGYMRKKVLANQDKKI